MPNAKKLKSKTKINVKKKPLKKKPTPKSKRKTPTKTRVKKTPTKSNTKKKITKLKLQPKRKLNTKNKKPDNSKSNFTETQKIAFLELVDHIVELHRHEKEGLKSLDGINRILDKYNQHFPGSIEKFDAIVKYGMEKDTALTNHSVSIVVDSRRYDENELYKLLNLIWEGNIDFKDAKLQIESIYQKAKDEKIKKHEKH